MTYMYNGTVSVPHNKLQTFLKTAEALKIKGIVDTGTSDDSAVSDTSMFPLVSPVSKLRKVPSVFPLCVPAVPALKATESSLCVPVVCSRCVPAVCSRCVFPL